MNTAQRDIRAGHRRAAGFTLIELLVVIVVIGLLIAALVGIGNVVIYNQKVRNTQAIMRNVGLAIDTFAEKDPLRLIYNGKNPTFGPYPPYQLRRQGAGQTVWSVLEPSPPGGDAGRLDQRIGRDVFNLAAPYNPSANQAWLDDNDLANDDIRSLYTYLALFTPSALTQVPESAVKALTSNAEWVNPTSGGYPNDAAKMVFGFHDAWGVPLDYFLYVKVEWGLLPDGSTGLKITDRVPVLRSRGIPREVYDVQRTDNNAQRDASKWILSTELPSPVAAVEADSGQYLVSDQTGNGWVRVAAREEDYRYIPNEADGTEW